MFRLGSPLQLLLGFYIVFVGFKYFYMKDAGELPPGADQFVWDHLIVFGFMTAVLILLKISGYFRESVHIKPRLDQDYSLQAIRRSENAMLVSIAMLIAVGAMGGVFPWSDPLGFRQEIQGGGKSYFFLFFYFYLKLYGCLFFLMRKRGWMTARSWLCFFILLVFSLISGFGSAFALIFLTGYVFLSARFRQKVISITLLLIATIAVVSTPYYTVIREAIRFGGGFDWDLITNIADRRSGDFLAVLVNRFDYGNNFIIASEVMRDHVDPLLALNLFAQPIPRGLFPAKPDNFSTMATKWIYPEVVDIGVTANFGFISEFILYFGDFGIIIAALFITTIMAWGIKKFIQSKESDSAAIFYAVIIYYFVCAFPAGYINDMAIPALLMNLLFWAIHQKFILRGSPQSPKI